MKIQEIIYRGCEDEDYKLSRIFNMQIQVRDRSNSNVIREFCSLSYSLSHFSNQRILYFFNEHLPKET